MHNTPNLCTLGRRQRGQQLAPGRTTSCHRPARWHQCARGTGSSMSKCCTTSQLQAEIAVAIMLQPEFRKVHSPPTAAQRNLTASPCCLVVLLPMQGRSCQELLHLCDLPCALTLHKGGETASGVAFKTVAEVCGSSRSAWRAEAKTFALKTTWRQAALRKAVATSPNPETLNPNPQTRIAEDAFLWLSMQQTLVFALLRSFGSAQGRGAQSATAKPRTPRAKEIT